MFPGSPAWLAPPPPPPVALAEPPFEPPPPFCFKALALAKVL